MNLRVLPGAQKETEQAAEWYEDQRPGLGADFLLALDAVYTNIEAHPHRPLRVKLSGLEDREFHQTVLRRFPYKVVYEVGEKEIIVIAVAHARRKPQYWSGRV